MKSIKLRGVRTHNLKNVDIDIPRNKFTVITGLSGSGKSSLAFDTIYAEGQRRYVESLSSYARQFLSMMEKPDVDYIEGLSPAISIEQKSTSHNPRSTVGTVTEIYDYIRLLFARSGEARCPEHGNPLKAQTVTQIVDKILTENIGSKWMLTAPVLRGKKGEHHQLLSKLQSLGFVRAIIDGEIVVLDDPPKLEMRKKHDIDLIIDRFAIKSDMQLRLSESVETGLEYGEGIVKIVPLDRDNQNISTFSSKFSCPVCGFSAHELEPSSFSFNSPQGACLSCDGLGYLEYFDEELVVGDPSKSLPSGAIFGWDTRNSYYSQIIKSLARHYKFDVNTPYIDIPEDIQNKILRGSGNESIEFSYLRSTGKIYKKKHTFEGVIPSMQRRLRESASQPLRDEMTKFLSVKPCIECNGSRLNISARNVFFEGYSINEITEMSIGQAIDIFKKFEGQKNDEVRAKIINEILNRLGFMGNIGLDYLTLDRKADTLSGGEAQRIRLASQIGAGLVGVMYVLDEPSIGLHQRDNKRLLDTLFSLRDLGNTVIVVEHDEEAIRSADHVIDIGPGAGVHGGNVVAQGSLKDILQSKDSETGKFLSGIRNIDVPEPKTDIRNNKKIEIKGAVGNNLNSVNLQIPVGSLTCVTGVSGSGKSTLINDTLYRIAARHLNGASVKPAKYDSFSGLEFLDKVVNIDQSPIGRTPRSNPATYTGLFGPIRDLFAATKESRSRGYLPGRFSFNVKGGRCEQCQGDGLVKVEMHFLPDLYVECENCKGKRYNRETLDIVYKGFNIYEILKMTVAEAMPIFEAVPSIYRKLELLNDVGLSYIKLGQSATTLSGGEAQRIKLAKELSRRSTGSTLYILDEPTTGLHFHDIEQLLEVIQRLKKLGNTIVIIEHNLDVVKTADWIVDLGPEGGKGGGNIVATGSPHEIINLEGHTAYYLRQVIENKIAV